jgi:hypothetical protein
MAKERFKRMKNKIIGLTVELKKAKKERDEARELKAGLDMKQVIPVPREELEDYKEATARVEALQGLPFSDRMYGAIKSRMERAEGKLAAASAAAKAWEVQARGAGAPSPPSDVDAAPRFEPRDEDAVPDYVHVIPGATGHETVVLTPEGHSMTTVSRLELHYLPGELPVAVLEFLLMEKGEGPDMRYFQVERPARLGPPPVQDPIKPGAPVGVADMDYRAEASPVWSAAVDPLAEPYEDIQRLRQSRGHSGVHSMLWNLRRNVLDPAERLKAEREGVDGETGEDDSDVHHYADQDCGYWKNDGTEDGYCEAMGCSCEPPPNCPEEPEPDEEGVEPMESAEIRELRREVREMEDELIDSGRTYP